MIKTPLLLILIAMILSNHTTVSAKDRVITDFAPGSEDLRWQITDDGVMGGRSKGQFKITNANTLEFKGLLSLENNGGFSSVRSETIELDLGDKEGLRLKVKGDGRTYQLRLATNARYRSWEVSFSADFKTKENTWTDVRVPFSEFKAGFRGRSLRDVTFDPSKIRRIGILLGDKKPGSFNLEIDSMVAYSGQSENTLADILAGDSRFETLSAALTRAGLVDALSGENDLTIFAPTDTAFSKLPDGTIEALLVPENAAELTSILKYHVVSGRQGLSDALKEGALETLQGNAVRILFQKGAVLVNDSTLETADIPASNGLIHVIDKVLQFPTSQSAQQVTSLNEPPTKVDARTQIVNAIQIGVPLYNHGDPVACAKTYQNCIRSLRMDSQLSDALKANLNKSLEMANGKSADERAWLFRFALDQTLASLGDHSL